MARARRHPRSADAPAGLPRELQLATLVDAAPAGDAWLHERKYDGYRILAHVEAGAARLYSRRFHDWTAQLPGVARALARLPCRRAILDGEVVVIEPDGRTSFQALQNAFGAHAAAAPSYFVFDLLALDDDELAPLPLVARKARLEALLARAPAVVTDVVRYSDHVVGGGPAFFRAACEIGLEGIVSKRRDQPYAPGRGGGWLKTKCLQRQEVVIGGFTDPHGHRSGIGSLIAGVYEAGVLVYAGKVGTGFTARLLTELYDELAPLEVDQCPFDPVPPRAWTGPARAHWVQPVRVAEVAFSEWTADGRMRHPSFKGLRRDKSAREVTRERAAPAPAPAAAPSRSRRRGQSTDRARPGRPVDRGSLLLRSSPRRGPRAARRSSAGRRPRAPARSRPQ